MVIDSWQAMARRGAPSVDDVSALAHFFPATSSRLVDTKGGVIYDPYSATYDDSTKTVTCSEPEGNTNARPLAEGGWHTFSGSFGALVVCKPREIITAANAALYLGFRDEVTTTAPAIFLAGGITTESVAVGFNDQNNAHFVPRPTPVVTVGASYLYVLTVDKSANYAEGKRFNLDTMGSYINHSPGNTVGAGPSLDGSTDAVATATSGGTTVTNAAPVVMQPYMRAPNIELYGAAFFDFSENGIPADWQLGCHWMAWAFLNGWRVPYPRAIHW